MLMILHFSRTAMKAERSCCIAIWQHCSNYGKASQFRSRAEAVKQSRSESIRDPSNPFFPSGLRPPALRKHSRARERLARTFSLISWDNQSKSLPQIYASTANLAKNMGMTLMREKSH